MDILEIVKILLAVLGIAVGIGCIGTVWYVIKKVRSFSRIAFGTPNFAEGFRNQAEIEAATPKSVSGMTRIELPRIQRDFPEFNWIEWRQRCEQQLVHYLEALEHQNPALLKEGCPALREQLRLDIAKSEELERRESFSNTRIHQTEICRYDRNSVLCRILVQTSLEYHHSLKNPSVSLTDQKEQHRYSMDLVYVQDADQVSGTALGVNCPNCGAPVRSLGSRHCAYCGSGLEPINIRVWQIQQIRKDL